MRTLLKGQVLDQWSNLLEGCQGLGESVLQAVERNLQAAQAPGVVWKRETVAPGWLKGFMGARRDFLSVTSPEFKKYIMCVNARDFGNNLNVAWYLALEPPLSLGALILILILTIPLFFTPLLYLFFVGLRASRQPNIFDQQDLQAYVTVAHTAVIKAVEQVMRERELDVGRLERRSRAGLAVA